MAMTERRVMCFGDSNTWGLVPVATPPSVRHPRAQRWPHVMAAALGGDVTVIEEGLNGRTTDAADPLAPLLGGAGLDGSAYFPAALASHLPLDLVIIMLGTNDTKPWNWDKHGKDFEANTISMINLFKKLPTHPKVYICYPPKILKPSYHIIEANLVRGVIPAITKAAHVTHTPIINVFAKLPGIPKYYDRDGVHPNIKGEAIMAHIIAKAIRY